MHTRSVDLNPAYSHRRPTICLSCSALLLLLAFEEDVTQGWSRSHWFIYSSVFMSSHLLFILMIIGGNWTSQLPSPLGSAPLLDSARLLSSAPLLGLLLSEPLNSDGMGIQVGRCSLTALSRARTLLYYFWFRFRADFHSPPEHLTCCLG